MAFLDEFEASERKSGKSTFLDEFEAQDKPEPSLLDRAYNFANKVFRPSSVIDGRDGTVVDEPPSPSATQSFRNVMDQAEMERQGTLNAGARVVDGLPGIAEVGARKGWAGIGRIEAGALKALADVLGADSLDSMAGAMQRRANEVEAGAVLRGSPVEGFARDSIVQDVPEAATNAIGSVIQTAPALAGAVVAPEITLPALFASTTAQEYGEGREDGLNGAGAAIRAPIMGAFEVFGEKLGGAGKIAEGINAAARGNGVADLGAAMLASSLRELPSEEVTTTGQFLTDKLPGVGLNQDAGLEEYGEAVKDTALATILQSAAMGAGGRVIQRAAEAADTPAPDVGDTQPPANTEAILESLERAREFIEQPTEEAAPSTFMQEFEASEASNERDTPALPDAGLDTGSQGRQPDFGTGSDGDGVLEPLAPDDIPAQAAARDDGSASISMAVPADGELKPAQDRIAEKRDVLQAWLPDLDWSQVGGRIIRDEDGQVSGRTSWEPKDYNFDEIRKEVGVSYPAMQKAVRKALNGEKLGKKEQAVVNALMDFHDSMVAESAGEAADTWSVASQEEQDALNAALQDAAWLDFLGENATTDDLAAEIARFYEEAQNDSLKAERAYDETHGQAESAVGENPATAPPAVRQAVDVAPAEDRAGQDQPGANREEPRPAVTPAAAPAAAPAPSPERPGVRTHIEALIKRRAAANELGKSRAFDNALAAAKQLLAGEDVKPSKFKNAASTLSGDKRMQEALMALHDIAKAPKEAPAVEEPLLTAPTPEDLQARDQATDAQRREQEQAQRKQKADDQRGDFVLTGSDRDADQAAARGAQDLFAQPDASGSIEEQADAIEPAAADAIEPIPTKDIKAAEDIQDFGEKIGGARKDKAKPLGPRARIEKAEDERPAWARRYHAMKNMRTGKWDLAKDSGGAKGMVSTVKRGFDSEQDALNAIPLVEVSRNHRVYSYGEGASWGIFRNITERKRALVKGGFSSYEEAMQEMAGNPVPIIEHKFAFPERPWLDNIEREGAERRTGDVTPKMFQEAFGFRGGEFGNWNKGGDGQAALNYAYDALQDFAETLGVPPKALSLNGELAIAFGARGTGGKNSASAHYEPGYQVFNLTKIKGAGSLAHEWWHAVDHYFARNGGFKDSYSVVAGGFRRDSEARPELMEAIKRVVDTMMHSEKTKVTDADVIRKGAQKRIDSALGDLDYRLNDLRNPYSPKRPFTTEELQQWDALVEKLRNGDMGETVYIENPSKMRGAMGFTTGSNIRELNAIYKAATGRSFLRTDPSSVGRQMYWMVKAIQESKEKLDTQEAVTSSFKGRTEYYLEAQKIDGYRSSDYWSMPEELGARAFESYIFDKMMGEGKRSDYLVYGVENRFYSALDMKPYPEGDERRAINAAFDNLFDVIQTKETDSGTAMFSRSESVGGMSLDDVRAVLEAIEREHPNLPRVIVVESQGEIPEIKAKIDKALEQYRQDDTADNLVKLSQLLQDDIEGAYVDGKIYIVASNIRDEQRLREVYAHEGIGHYSIEAMLNAAQPKLFDRLVQRVVDLDRSKNSYVRKLAGVVDRRQPGLDATTRAKEIIALIAERGDQDADMTPEVRSLWQRIADAIKAFAKLVFDVELNDQDVRDVVAMAARHARGESTGTIAAGGETVTYSDQAEPLMSRSGKPGKDNWLVRRDDLGRIQLAPTGKVYDVASTIIKKGAEAVNFAYAPPELRRMMRKMKADVQNATELAGDVAKNMKGMSESDRRMVSDVIERMLKTGATPPDHVLKVAVSMQEIMDKQTDDLVALGMLSGESAERWRGQYLPRFYVRERDPGLEGLNPLIRAFRTSKPIRGLGGGSLKGRGLYEEVPVRDVEQWEALGWEVRDPLWKKNRQGKLELVDPDKAMPDAEKVVVWRDFSPEERERMGENRDAMFRFVMGYTAMQKDVALGRLFDSIAKNQEFTRARASEGYTKVPDSVIPETGGVHRYGNLAGLYVRDDIMAHISQYEESSELLQGYRKALSFWKAGKTVLNPVAHVNNVISNLTMAHFAGVSYWDGHKYVEALRDLYRNTEMVKEAKDAGLFSGDLSREEFLSEMPDDIKAMMDQQDSLLKKGSRVAYNIATLWLSKPLVKAYRSEDDFFKYLIYRDARNNGMAPADAVDYATQYIFNYDDLPKGARVVRDAAIPFFAYTYKAVPALAHTAANYPWRFAAPAALIAGVNAMAYALIAGDDDDDLQERFAKGRELEEQERKHLPPWMQGRSALGTDKTVRLGTDAKTGLPVYWDISRFIPGGDLFDVTNQAEGLPLPAPIMPSNPLLTSIAALVWNKDTFTGKDITDKNDTPAEAAKKRGDWALKMISPAIAPTGYHADKLAQAAANGMGETIETPFKDYTGMGKDGLPVQPKYAAMQTVGIKARPVDLEASADIAKGKDVSEVRSIRGEIMQAKRLLNRGAISPREFERIRDDGKEKIKRIRAAE